MESSSGRPAVPPPKATARRAAAATGRPASTPDPLARPTIKDVARESRVAASTVSRAFLHPGRVNPVTADRIFAVAEQLGYRPNPVARALPSGRTLMLALLVPDVTNPFYFHIIRGAERRAAAAGYTTVLADTEESAEVEERHLERLVPMVDGVVFATSRMPDRSLAGHVSRRHMVLINREAGDAPSVVLDTITGFKQAAEHLVSLGHRSLMYVAGPRSSWSDARRWRAVQAAGRRLGVPVSRIGPFAPAVAGGAAAADAIVMAKATAVLAYNDLLAIGVLRRLIDRGLRVPADVSVVGCDNIFGSDLCQPALTTLDSPAEEAGRVAVDLLLGALGAGGTAARQHVLLPTHLLIRGSTGPAADTGRAAH